jgi:hypothetical protein
MTIEVATSSQFLVAQSAMPRQMRAFTHCSSGSAHRAANRGFVMATDDRRAAASRRSGKDRRSGIDTRTDHDKAMLGERRSGRDRRAGIDRRESKPQPARRIGRD